MSNPLPTHWNPDQRIGDMLKGKRGVRVFAVSPRPLRTRAASGIAQFDELIADAKARAPAQRLMVIAEVGRVVAFLVSGASSGMTGDTIYVDAGLHHVA